MVMPVSVPKRVVIRVMKISASSRAIVEGKLLALIFYPLLCSISVLWMILWTRKVLPWQHSGIHWHYWSKFLYMNPFLNNLDVMYVDTKLHLIFSECLLVWVCNVCTNEVYYDIGVSIAPRMVILKSGILNLCLKASSYFLCLFCWLTLWQVKSQFP